MYCMYICTIQSLTWPHPPFCRSSQNEPWLQLLGKKSKLELGHKSQHFPQCFSFIKIITFYSASKHILYISHSLFKTLIETDDNSWKEWMETIADFNPILPGLGRRLLLTLSNKAHFTPKNLIMKKFIKKIPQNINLKLISFIKGQFPNLTHFHFTFKKCCFLCFSIEFWNSAQAVGQLWHTIYWIGLISETL
jgi:hypothetical protein